MRLDMFGVIWILIKTKEIAFEKMLQSMKICIRLQTSNMKNIRSCWMTRGMVVC